MKKLRTKIDVLRFIVERDGICKATATDGSCISCCLLNANYANKIPCPMWKNPCGAVGEERKQKARETLERMEEEKKLKFLSKLQ